MCCNSQPTPHNPAQERADREALLAEPAPKHYPLEITTPAIQNDHRLNVTPYYADSVRYEEGRCVTFWRDGRAGRVCGEYSVDPR